MFVREVTTYFRKLVDEPNENFLSPADVQLYLAQGYEEFRAYVNSLDRMAFTVEVALGVVGGNELDLSSGSVVVLGSGALTGPRLLRIISIYAPNVNGPRRPELRPVSSVSALNYTPMSYCLQGTKLWFSEQASGNYTMLYMPVSSVDWTKTASTDNEFLDDFSPFHDLVALYAAPHYYIRDGIENPVVLRQTARREAQLAQHVMDRQFSAPQYVQHVHNRWG